MNFNQLKTAVENCKYCEKSFGFEPHPIFWGSEKAKIVQISQAPSNMVYEKRKPFMDASGKTLKYEWYQITDEEFYDTKNFFIGAMAHCYPGKNNNGNDKNPPKCCFEKWVVKELDVIDNEIYIIIGAKAAMTFFKNQNFNDLVFHNQTLNGKLALVLPHPSPLNRKWIKDHPLFLEKRIKEIRKIIKNCINHN